MCKSGKIKLYASRWRLGGVQLGQGKSMGTSDVFLKCGMF